MTDWLMLNKTSQRHAYVDHSLNLPLKLAWGTRITGVLVAQAVAAGNDLYVPTLDGVHRLDLQTGDLLWSFKTEAAKRGPDQAHMISTPAIWRDRLYLSDESFFVYCLNRESGELLWQTQKLWSANEFICVYKDRLFLKTTNPEAPTLSHARPGYLCLDPDGKIIWFVRSELDISTTAAIAEDVLLFGDQSGRVYGVQTQDGQIRWCTDVKTLMKSVSLPYRVYPYGHPIIVGSTALIKVAGRFYMGLDVQTGEVKWRYGAERGIYRRACDERNFYYVTTWHQCGCVDLETGQLRWLVDNRAHKLGDAGTPGDLSIVVGDAYIVGFNRSRKLVAFSTQDGRVMWEYLGGGGFTPPPILVNERLMVGCDDHYVYCFT